MISSFVHLFSVITNNTAQFKTRLHVGPDDQNWGLVIVIDATWKKETRNFNNVMQNIPCEYSKVGNMVHSDAPGLGFWTLKVIHLFNYCSVFNSNKVYGQIYFLSKWDYSGFFYFIWHWIKCTLLRSLRMKLKILNSNKNKFKRRLKATWLTLCFMSVEINFLYHNLGVDNAWGILIL